MRIGETAIFYDAPFHDLFSVRPSWATRLGFNTEEHPHGRRRRAELYYTKNDAPSEPYSRSATLRQPREIIIPIQIEGESEGCDVLKVNPKDSGSRLNLNNNGTHATHMKKNIHRESPLKDVRKRKLKDHSVCRDDTSSTCSPDETMSSGCTSRVNSNQSIDFLSVDCSSQGTDQYGCEDYIAITEPAVTSRAVDNQSEVQRRLGFDGLAETQTSTGHLTEPGSALRVSSSITDTPSYPVYACLKPRLEVDGRQIDYIRGDGNCFFRALSKDIYGSEDFHNDIRQAVVDLMEKYANEFKLFLFSELDIHAHIKEMRKPSTWASTMEIYAAATLLQRDIYILSPDHTGALYNWLLFSPRFVYNHSMTFHPCHITLCHTHGNHYDRITRIEGSCNCGVETPTLAGKTDYVDLTDEAV